MKKVITMLFMLAMTSTMFSQMVDSKPFPVCCKDSAIADIYIVIIDTIVGKPIIDQFIQLGGGIAESAMSPVDIVKFSKTKNSEWIKPGGYAYCVMLHNNGKDISIAEVVRSEQPAGVIINMLDITAKVPDMVPFINIIVPRKKITISKKWEHYKTN